jgi:hypothetical protein
MYRYLLDQSTQYDGLNNSVGFWMEFLMDRLNRYLLYVAALASLVGVGAPSAFAEDRPILPISSHAWSAADVGGNYYISGTSGVGEFSITLVSGSRHFRTDFNTGDTHLPPIVNYNITFDDNKTFEFSGANYQGQIDTQMSDLVMPSLLSELSLAKSMTVNIETPGVQSPSYVFSMAGMDVVMPAFIQNLQTLGIPDLPGIWEFNNDHNSNSVSFDVDDGHLNSQAVNPNTNGPSGVIEDIFLLVGSYLVVVTIGSLLIYFVPTLIAMFRKSRVIGTVFLLNLFLGWTLVGWIAAFVIALLSDRSSADVNYNPKNNF